MAAPAPKMVPGLNQNVNFRGQVFHVQTEDSGTAHPHLVTHVFAGGTILATRKSSYDHLLAEPDLESRVRALMDHQHKALLRDLIEGRLGTDPIGDKTLDEAIQGHLDGQIGK
jgi:hypothetical protein